VPRAMEKCPLALSPRPMARELAPKAALWLPNAKAFCFSLEVEALVFPATLLPPTTTEPKFAVLLLPRATPSALDSVVFPSDGNTLKVLFVGSNASPNRWPVAPDVTLLPALGLEYCARAGATPARSAMSMDVRATAYSAIDDPEGGPVIEGLATGPTLVSPDSKVLQLFAGFPRADEISDTATHAPNASFQSDRYDLFMNPLPPRARSFSC